MALDDLQRLRRKEQIQMPTGWDHMILPLVSGRTHQRLKRVCTEPPPTKVEGFSGLERQRRTVGSFPTEVGGFKPDFWKVKVSCAKRSYSSHNKMIT